jgi:hypothetical protein
VPRRGSCSRIAAAVSVFSADLAVHHVPLPRAGPGRRRIAERRATEALENAQKRSGGCAGQSRIALLHDPAAAASRERHSGRIAQLVEQLTLNQRVLGSSPSAPTNHINRLDWYGGGTKRRVSPRLQLLVVDCATDRATGF